MIIKDLETISKHGLLEKSTINQLKVKREFYRQLPSDTIPIYERVEMPKKSRKEHGNKFDPCVEVKGKNGESIFICKTTAVWLFQEGERVSADRFFKVWHKQPFSINTTVSDTLPGVPPFAAGTTSVVTGTPSGASVGTKSVVADTSVGTPSVGTPLTVTGTSSVATGTSVGTPLVVTGTPSCTSVVTGTSSVTTCTSVATPSVVTGTPSCTSVVTGTSSVTTCPSVGTPLVSSVATSSSVSTLLVETGTSSSAVVTSVATGTHSAVTSTSVGTLSVNVVTNTLTGALC